MSTVWAFDLDGTLIGSVRSDVLRPGALALLGELGVRGCTCVLWSAGGAEYAQRVAHTHGLTQHVAGYYGKPDRHGRARYGVDHFPDHHRPAVFVDDSPGDLPDGAHIVAVPQFIGGNPADRALLDVLAAVRAGTSCPATGRSPRVSG